MGSARPPGEDASGAVGGAETPTELLIVSAGDGEGHDGLAAALRRRGAVAAAIDTKLGGQERDALVRRVRESSLADVRGCVPAHVFIASACGVLCQLPCVGRGGDPGASVVSHLSV